MVLQLKVILSGQEVMSDVEDIIQDALRRMREGPIKEVVFDFPNVEPTDVAFMVRTGILLELSKLRKDDKISELSMTITIR